MQRVEIPYAPRQWAKPFHASLKRFAAVVLHRRAGKTTALVNHHQRAATDDALERRRLLALRPTLTDKQLAELVNPPGGRHYGHVMPTRVQAKAAVWDKLKYYAGGIPGVKFNETELLVRYPLGHKFQLFGADDPDSFRSMAFSGLSFDEFSFMPANIFSEVLSKALGDHLGYAVFLGTIKGEDHLYKTYQAGLTDPDWFTLWQDIDTSLASESGITIQLLEQAMADDRKQIALDLMSDEEYQQEWYLSTVAAIKGAYYLKQLAAMRKENRVRQVPYDPALLVHDVWDLGKGPNMAIGLFQRFGRQVQMIDYLEGLESDGIPQMIAELRKRPYVWGKHIAPHDIMATDLSTGQTRWKTAKGLGWTFTLAPDHSVEDGINACRLWLARLWVDEGACKPWLTAMQHYRRPWNEKLGVFGDKPVHDFASHPADMARYAAVSEHLMTNEPEQAVVRPYVPVSAWG